MTRVASLGAPCRRVACVRRETILMDFTDYIDLAAERLGGRVLAANDEFFAPKENLLKAAAPVWDGHKYTDVGKWMDGWETRRRRTPGYDWCIVRLGLPGLIHGVVVDTANFKGNYPEQCELECCAIDGDPCVEKIGDVATLWSLLLPNSQLTGDTRNRFAVSPGDRVTHLRFKIYPDGGVARLRVHGEVLPDWKTIVSTGEEIDLAAVEHGGLVVDSSDMFFGSRNNLILPERFHGDARWLGNAPPSRPRDMTGVSCDSGYVRHAKAGGGRHFIFQGEFSGKLLAGSVQRRTQL